MPRPKRPLVLVNSYIQLEQQLAKVSDHKKKLEEQHDRLVAKLLLKMPNVGDQLPGLSGVVEHAEKDTIPPELYGSDARQTKLLSVLVMFDIYEQVTERRLNTEALRSQMIKNRALDAAVPREMKPYLKVLPK